MEEEQNYGLTTTPQNGSQGDPLSMILYIIYDSDLVRTASGKQELTLAFVDDTAFLAIGKMFQEMHQILRDMLERSEGGFEWSNLHNSCFSPSKFALIDFSLNRTKERPPLVVRGTTINPSHPQVPQRHT